MSAVIGRHKSSAAKHVQSVRKIIDLWKIGGDQDDSSSILKQFGEELVDFDLCADVDPHGWFVEDVEIGTVVQPLSNNDLLLIAAREARRRCLARGSLYLHFADLAIGGRSLGERVD